MTNNKKGPHLILEEKLGKLSIIRKVCITNLKKISETQKANKNLETNSEKLGEQIGIQKKIQI